MVRKAPATIRRKGSQKNETRMAGITGAADFLQPLGEPVGITLDEAVAKDARNKSVEDVIEDVPYDL